MRGLRLRLSAAAGAFCFWLALPRPPRHRDPAGSKPGTAAADATTPTPPATTTTPTPAPAAGRHGRADARAERNPAPARAGDPEAGGAGSDSPLRRPPRRKQAPRAAGRNRPHPSPRQVARARGGIDNGTVLDVARRRQRHPHRQIPRRRGRASASDIERSARPTCRRASSRPCRAPSLRTRRATGSSRTCSIAASTPRPSTACRRGSRSTRTACASTRSFGDIVNWDFLPDSAIEGITIVGANPVFGLNALGGAVTILMRDGFNFQGTEIDVRGGSFGRYQGELATGPTQRHLGRLPVAGRHPGQRLAPVLAGDDPARLRRPRRQGRHDRGPSQLHRADNFVGVTAAAPVQLLDLNWSNSFTSPQIDRQQGDDGVAQRSGEGDADAHVLRRQLLPLVPAEARRRQHRRCVRTAPPAPHGRSA